MDLLTIEQVAAKAQVSPRTRGGLTGRGSSTEAQTRRVLRPQPHEKLADTVHYDRATGGAMWASIHGDHGVACPYGKPGDRLWVRETFAFNVLKGHGYRYRADQDRATDGWKWTPAIHMPRAACRLVLEVTAVRVERLQEISENDAMVEGMRTADGDGLGPGPGYKWHGTVYHGAGFTKHGEPTFHTPGEGGRCSCWAAGPTPAQCAYRELWDSLNAQRGFGWEKNPWVWCIEFRRVEEKA